MTVAVFVDTNVLVYTRDSRNNEKREMAEVWMEHLWRTGSGRLSQQVIQEFYSTVTAKLKPGLEVRIAREAVRAMMAWRPISVDNRVLEGAWLLQDRYRLSWWDALIVSAAQITDCRYLLTEDLQDGQDLGGVEVINPFTHSPTHLKDDPIN